MSNIEVSVPSSASLMIQLEVLQFRVGGRLYSVEVDRDGFPRLLDEELEYQRFAEEMDRRMEEPRERRRRPSPARRGKPWTSVEEELLRDGFTAGEEMSVMAKQVDRSSGAVRARLVKLGLLDEAAAGLRYPVSREDAPVDEGGVDV